jgi:hypothetical protein
VKQLVLGETTIDEASVEGGAVDGFDDAWQVRSTRVSRRT